MLNNTNQKTPRNNDSDQSPKPIQDPWSIPNQVQEQKIIPEALQLGKELGCVANNKQDKNIL